MGIVRTATEFLATLHHPRVATCKIIAGLIHHLRPLHQIDTITTNKFEHMGIVIRINIVSLLTRDIVTQCLEYRLLRQQYQKLVADQT